MPFTNAGNQTTIPLGYIDPATEIIDARRRYVAPVAGDGTQIWKITHNGVDTHAIHFHLFNVQVINRVGWDGAIRPPDANELGWKETVRMNPLEDIIVALRPTTPKLPFGVPDSVRLLDVTAPPGLDVGSSPASTRHGNPITITNQLINFGWEYVWHCHLLGHEENDMMRPTVFNAPRLLPPAPTGVTYSKSITTGLVTLGWADSTPFDYATGLPAATLGNPANEIGFRIDRAPVTRSGKIGTWVPVGSTLANATTWTEPVLPPPPPNNNTWGYRVVAFNVAGIGASSIVPGVVLSTLPADPSGMQAVLVAGPQVSLTWVDNSTNETGFAIERQTNGGAFGALATVGTNVTSYTNATVTAGNTYTYRVRAVNAAGTSGYSTSGPVPVLVPAAPTGPCRRFRRQEDRCGHVGADQRKQRRGHADGGQPSSETGCPGPCWTNPAFPAGDLQRRRQPHHSPRCRRSITYNYRVRANQGRSVGLGQRHAVPDCHSILRGAGASYGLAPAPRGASEL